MVSRRKLEEEIARSKDPVLRKQLQELLEKRNKRLEEKGKIAGEFLERGKEAVNSLINVLPGFIIIFISMTVAMVLILRLILWLAILKAFGAIKPSEFFGQPSLRSASVRRY